MTRAAVAAIRSRSSRQLPLTSERKHTASPATQRMPSTMSTTSAPHLAATRTASTRPGQFMDAPPTPLLALAANMPAMAVPCHELGST